MNTEEREPFEAARLIAEAQKRSKMRRANLEVRAAPARNSARIRRQWRASAQLARNSSVCATGAQNS